MFENFMTCNRYIPSLTRNIDLDFYQKWGVNEKVDSTVIGPIFRD
jgi:hypothetical protein